MLTRVALPPGVPIAGEPDVNVVGGRNIFAWSSRTIYATYRVQSPGKINVMIVPHCSV